MVINKVYDSEGKPIEGGNYYVVSTDSFMSGWGRAEGKKNILICVCGDLHEARIVINTIKNRNEMSKPMLFTEPPEFNKELFYIQKVTKDKYPEWYR